MKQTANLPNQKPRSEQRQRQAVVSVRLLPHEHEAVAAAAATRGVSIAEMLRTAVLQTVAAG